MTVTLPRTLKSQGIEKLRQQAWWLDKLVAEVLSPYGGSNRASFWTASLTALLGFHSTQDDCLDIHLFWQTKEYQHGWWVNWALLMLITVCLSHSLMNKCTWLCKFVFASKACLPVFSVCHWVSAIYMDKAVVPTAIALAVGIFPPFHPYFCRYLKLLSKKCKIAGRLVSHLFIKGIWDSSF